MRSLVAMRSMVTVDPALLLRAIEVHEVDRRDFAEAYAVAWADSTGVGVVASFDKAVDCVGTVARIQPCPLAATAAWTTVTNSRGSPLRSC